MVRLNRKQVVALLQFQRDDMGKAEADKLQAVLQKYGLQGLEPVPKKAPRKPARNRRGSRPC